MATRSPELFDDSDRETTASDEVPPYQKPKTAHSAEPKARTKRKYAEQPHNNKRHRSMSDKVKRNNEAIHKLKLHTQNKTCPSSLRYAARATVNADKEFKQEVTQIKRRAEQEYLRALIKFHYRDIERLNREQKRNVIDNVTHSAPKANVTEINVTKVESLEQELRELKELLNKNSAFKIKQEEKYQSLNIKSTNANKLIHKNPNLKTRNIISFKKKIKPYISKTKARKIRRTKQKIEREKKLRQNNEQYIQNMSNERLSNEEISLLAKGLKFVPTQTKNEQTLRKQIMQDFNNFARRMRIRYIIANNKNKQHPFHVKSNWEPPTTQSVALESFLDEAKLELSEAPFEKIKDNLTKGERTALKKLKTNKKINLKKADKGTTTVVMNKEDKIKEGQVQLDNTDHYKPIDQPMVSGTASKVEKVIKEMYINNFIDGKTKEWLLQTQNPPRIPEFYTLTKIHKPKPVGRPIISGCGGPTEKISAFVDQLLQPIAKNQKSYIKDTTDFINFIENKKFPEETLLVTMDVTSLYTNIPQEEGTQIVCKAYDRHYQNNPPVPTEFLREMLRLILKENSFKFTNKSYLQLSGCAMGTKMAVAFANIFMGEIETQIVKSSETKPIEWKRFIDDIASFWTTTKDEVLQFIKKANEFHPTIKFTAEISDSKTTFLDTTIYKGKRFYETGILDVSTHFKPTEKFQYTHFTSCHPPGVKKGFVKGEATRLLRTNSNANEFRTQINNFKKRLSKRGYMESLIKETLAEVKFEGRSASLKNKPKGKQNILPFVTEFNPAKPNIKKILSKNWFLIENQPHLNKIFPQKPIISYKRASSLKDILVKAKL